MFSRIQNQVYIFWEKNVNFCLDTNSCNQRNAAAIYYNKAGSFEILQGLLDRIMEVLEVKFDSNGSITNQLTYYIRGKDRKD